METEFKPPWLLYPIAWLSMGWNQGSAQKDNFEFQRWYLDLTEDDQGSFKAEYPESPWWPGYYFYIENIGKKNLGGINPIEYIKDVNRKLRAYANTQYQTAVDLEARGDLKGAHSIYADLRDNSHGCCENIEQVMKFLDNY